MIGTDPFAMAGWDSRTGSQTICYTGLEPEQVKELHALMLHNGAGEQYTQRALAGAHLARWEPNIGVAEIHLHGAEHAPFIDTLESRTGLTIRNKS